MSSDHEVCAICLDHPRNKSFVDGCFHVFCLDCITKWAGTIQKAPRCPLCNHSFTSVVYDVISPKQFKRFMVDPAGTWGRCRDSTKEEDARLAVYSRSLIPFSPQKPLFTFSVSRFQKMEISNWVSRELRALLNLDDVYVIMNVIVGDAEKFGFSSRALRVVVEPFLFGRTDEFIRELQYFVQQNCTVSYFDNNAAYRDRTGRKVLFRELVRTVSRLPISTSTASESQLESPPSGSRQTPVVVSDSSDGETDTSAGSFPSRSLSDRSGSSDSWVSFTQKEIERKRKLLSELDDSLASDRKKLQLMLVLSSGRAKTLT